MTEIKLLRRSHIDRKIAGVSAGVAEYFGIDPTVVRVAFVLAVVFTGGWAAVAYPLMWILMPEAPKPTPMYPEPVAAPMTPAA